MIGNVTEPKEKVKTKEKPTGARIVVKKAYRVQIEECILADLIN